MTTTRVFLIFALVGVFRATPAVGDEMDARANGGRPLRIDAPKDESQIHPASLTGRGAEEAVEQWTALATRVSLNADVPGASVEKSSAASGSPSVGGRTLSRTVGRREGAAGDGAVSPLEALRTTPIRGWAPLAATIALIVALALAYRKWAPGQGRVAGGRVIQVLSRHALSNKHSLCLVRVGQGLVLLGVTPERIATLIEITDPEEVSRILGTARSSHGESFSTTLRGLSGRPADTEAAEGLEPARTMPAARLLSAGEAVRELVTRVRQFSGASGVAKPI